MRPEDLQKRRPFLLQSAGIVDTGCQQLAIRGRSSILHEGVHPSTKEEHVKNPLDSLWGTVISGLVLTLILYWIVKLALGS
jgi:hypothetical protein